MGDSLPAQVVDKIIEIELRDDVWRVMVAFILGMLLGGFIVILSEAEFNEDTLDNICKELTNDSSALFVNPIFKNDFLCLTNDTIKIFGDVKTID